MAYSVGSDLDERVRTAITATPEQVWEAVLDATGEAREDAQAAEVTGLLRRSAGGDRLDTWPAGMRIMVRREHIQTGAQLSLFGQLGGYRYQPIATATASGQVQLVRDQHRVGDRGRDRDRPAVLTRLLMLDGPLAKAEPATLRYRLLHTLPAWSTTPAC